MSDFHAQALALAPELEAIAGGMGAAFDARQRYGSQYRVATGFVVSFTDLRDLRKAATMLRTLAKESKALDEIRVVCEAPINVSGDSNPIALANLYANRFHLIREAIKNAKEGKGSERYR